MKYLNAILQEGTFFPDYTTTTLRDVQLRDGTTIPEGSEITIDFNTEQEAVMNIIFGGKKYRMPIEVAHRYIKGFQRPPRNIQLQRELEANDGMCSTPVGGMVHPTKHGRYGEPSWMRILAKNM